MSDTNQLLLLLRLSNLAECFSRSPLNLFNVKLVQCQWNSTSWTLHDASEVRLLKLTSECVEKLAKLAQAANLPTCHLEASSLKSILLLVGCARRVV